MLYRPSPSENQPTAVTGCSIAYGRRSAVERAFLAADLHRGHISLTRPTIGQSAVLACVCPPYVRAAIKIATDIDVRQAVLTGRRLLLDTTKAADPESLIAHFKRASSAERLEAARAIGPAAIWDELISPLI